MDARVWAEGESIHGLDLIGPAKRNNSWQAEAGQGEGTISQGIQVCGLRRSRDVGLEKTHLQHVFTAVVISLERLATWFEGTPRSKRRPSRFAALAVAA